MSTSIVCNGSAEATGQQDYGNNLAYFRYYKQSHDL